MSSSSSSSILSMSSVSLRSSDYNPYDSFNDNDDYVFEYKLDDNNRDYKKYLRSHSSRITQPTFQAYETYPSNISITLNNKNETWFQYIKRQVNRFFGCFSIKIYSEINDLSKIDV